MKTDKGCQNNILKCIHCYISAYINNNKYMSAVQWLFVG